METNFNRIGTKHLFITDWKGSIELLRLDYKKAGVFVYLPRDLVGFLHLDKEQDRSLVAFLDSSGEYNFIIITSDKNLSELLKPLILEKRQRAEKLQEQLKMKLQTQQQAETEAETAVDI